MQILPNIRLDNYNNSFPNHFPSLNIRLNTISCVCLQMFVVENKRNFLEAAIKKLDDPHVPLQFIATDKLCSKQYGYF